MDQSRPTPTLDEIRGLPWAGSHALDVQRFELCRRFIADQGKPMPERVEALRLMCRDGMGVDRPATEADVAGFLAGHS